MPYREPTWWANLPAAFMGAGIYGFYNLAILLKSGNTPTVRDVVGVVVNMVCALGVGVIVSVMFADRAAAMIPFASLKDAFLVTFIFSAFSWELLPWGYKAAVAAAQKFGASKIGGGQ